LFHFITLTARNKVASETFAKAVKTNKVLTTGAGIHTSAARGSVASAVRTAATHSHLVESSPVFSVGGILIAGSFNVGIGIVKPTLGV
jgi:hypothetical protein